MNEPYRDYSRAIRDELEGLKNQEIEKSISKKKKISFYQKVLRIFITKTKKHLN